MSRLVVKERHCKLILITCNALLIMLINVFILKSFGRQNILQTAIDNFFDLH